MKFPAPIWSCFNENEKKNRKNLKIENSGKREHKWSGDMVERELPTMFGLDVCPGFRTDERQTDDGRDSSSADRVKQT